MIERIPRANKVFAERTKGVLEGKAHSKREFVKLFLTFRSKVLAQTEDVIVRARQASSILGSMWTSSQ
jgi:hypothetical protein